MQIEKAWIDLRNLKLLKIIIHLTNDMIFMIIPA